MIIDTNNMDLNWFRKVSGLINSCVMLPDDNEVFNNIDQNGRNYINYDYIIEDGKSIFKFGNCGKFFTLSGGSDDYKIPKKERRNLKSLKNFPIKCEEFLLNSYKIKDIDYLPTSNIYSLYKCKIEKISYPFPVKIHTLELIGNKISTFNNFPKEVNTLILEDNKYINSEGIPYIHDELDISNNKTLKTLNIKGSLQKVFINNLSKLESISITPNIKDLKIWDCVNLETIKGIEYLDSKCEIYIDNCESLDIYDLLKTKAKLIFNIKNINNKSLFMIAPFKLNDKDEEIVIKKSLVKNITRLEFEKIIFDYWTTDIRTIEMLNNVDFKTEEFIKMKLDILKVDTTINKYKL